MNIGSYDGEEHGMKMQRVSHFSEFYGHAGSLHSTHGWPAEPKLCITDIGVTRTSLHIRMSETGGVSLFMDAPDLRGLSGL